MWCGRATTSSRRSAISQARKRQRTGGRWQQNGEQIADFLSKANPKLAAGDAVTGVRDDGRCLSAPSAIGVLLI
jgi:hypothetical protein